MGVELTAAAADEALEALRHLEDLVQGRSNEPLSLDVLDDAALAPGPASAANWVALR